MRLAEVNRAYRVLRDPKARLRYDMAFLSQMLPTAQRIGQEPSEISSEELLLRADMDFQAGNPAGARQACQRGLATAPSEYRFHTLLAEIALAQGLRTEAAQHYREAGRLAPEKEHYRQRAEELGVRDQGSEMPERGAAAGVGRVSWNVSPAKAKGSALRSFIALFLGLAGIALLGSSLRAGPQGELAVYGLPLLGLAQATAASFLVCLALEVGFVLRPFEDELAGEPFAAASESLGAPVALVVAIGGLANYLIGAIVFAVASAFSDFVSLSTIGVFAVAAGAAVALGSAYSEEWKATVLIVPNLCLFAGLLGWLLGGFFRPRLVKA